MVTTLKKKKGKHITNCINNECCMLNESPGIYINYQEKCLLSLHYSTTWSQQQCN